MVSLYVDVMELRDLFQGKVSHPLQRFGRGVQASLHGLDECIDISARNQPPLYAIVDELGYSRDKCTDYRSSKCHCFHDHDWKSFGKTRQNERPAGEKLL